MLITGLEFDLNLKMTFSDDFLDQFLHPPDESLINNEFDESKVSSYLLANQCVLSRLFFDLEFFQGLFESNFIETGEIT